MMKRPSLKSALFWILLFTFSCNPNAEQKTAGDYNDLVALFKEFRMFDNPYQSSELLDYTNASMQERHVKIDEFQQRLKAISSSDWRIAQQIDYHLVRAEMNGADFNHRVLRPWVRDPGFYVTRIPLPGDNLNFPLGPSELLTVHQDLVAIPLFFEQAIKNMQNLNEVSGDLADFAVHTLEHSNPFQALSDQLVKYHPELDSVRKEAWQAIEKYLNWIKKNRQSMMASVGVGKENYNWLLKNVYLFPYTWEECLRMVELEDNRVITFRELEKNRNRNLSPLEPVTSQEEYVKSYTQAIEHVMNFIKQKEIFTMPDYLVPDAYLQEEKNNGPYGLGKPWPKQHDYFYHFSFREPLMYETHEMVGHHFDLLRAQHDDRVIRGDREHEGPYHVSVARLEGFAFALEELMMHVGYLDERSPRSREIVYDQSAFRSVRALSDLHMHNQEWSLKEAMAYCVANAPQGHLLADSPHLWHEMHSTVTMVGWHAQMVVGKVHFMKLMRDRAQQLGDKFVLKEFMDEYLAAGVIPAALIRWEMTGNDDEIKKLW